MIQLNKTPPPMGRKATSYPVAGSFQGKSGDFRRILGQWKKKGGERSGRISIELHERWVRTASVALVARNAGDMRCEGDTPKESISTLRIYDLTSMMWVTQATVFVV